jgi:hypothetical protein
MIRAMQRDTTQPRRGSRIGGHVFLCLAMHLLAAPCRDARADADERGMLEESLTGTAVGELLNRSGLRVGGWTEASLTGAVPDDDLLPLGFNHRPGTPLLQQNWLRVEEPLDTEDSQGDWGVRSDWILPGSDYRFTLARGILGGQLRSDDGGPRRYGVDPVQFYAEASLPAVTEGLCLKFGRFFEPYGVESVEAVSTPLPSRSYTFIYNPFTATGLLASLPIADGITATAGATLGHDVFVDDAITPTALVGLRLDSPDGRESLSLFAGLGEGRYDEVEEFNNPNFADITYARRLAESLDLGVELLAGIQSSVPEVGTARWYGSVAYLTWRADEAITPLARLELFLDEDGNRTGRRGLYAAGTLGLAIRAKSWLLVRPEIRADRNDESEAFSGRRSAFSGVLDLVVCW